MLKHPSNFGDQTCHVCTQLEHVFSSCVHAWMKMTVCENYELDTSGIGFKRKKPYIKVLTDFVKLCSCGKIVKYVSCNGMMRKSAYFSHGTCINLVKHIDHIALVK